MKYRIENTSQFSKPGIHDYNEDIVGCNGSYFWIIDGATGLNNQNFMDCETDAKWYSNWWNNYLEKNTMEDIDLKILLKNGIMEVKKDFSLELKRKGMEFSKLTKLDYPSASISIIRFDEYEAEYLILGDCRIYTDDSQNRIICDKTISLLDQKVFESMKKIKNFGYIDLRIIKERVFGEIVLNRLKNNTSEGYWILSFDESAVDYSKHGKIELKKNTRFMMASDGYYSISDKYGIYDEYDLLDLTFSKGIENMYNTLRNFENDEDKIRFIPRFKKSDDASCLIFTYIVER